MASRRAWWHRARPTMHGDPGLRRQIRALRAFAAFTYPFACVPFLWFWFHDHGIDAAHYGTVIAVYYVTMVVAEVPTGLLADRFGRRPMLVFGPLLLSAGFLAVLLRTDFLGFCIGEGLLGLGHSVLSGAPAAMLFDALDAQGRGAEYHRQEAVANTIRLLGTGMAFLLGGALVAWHGHPAAIVATAVLCTIGACIGSLTRDSQRTGPSEARSPILASARREMRSPDVRWMVVYYLVLFCLLRFPFHTYQPFLSEAGAHDPVFIGALFCALNLVAAPFSRITPWLVAHVGERRLFWAMPLTIALSLLAMAGHFDAFGISLFFLHQIPFGTHWAIVHNYVNHRIRGTARATLLSLLSFTGRIAFAAIFPLAMALDDVSTAYRVFGTTALVATVLVMLRMPRTR